MMTPWKYIPASWAHRWAPVGIQVISEIFGSDQAMEWNSLDWKGIHFPNRLGIAGGLDKNGDLLREWQRLGAGFCEVGTVTPRPQSPNPGKILDRDWDRKNLWNRMGFPNEGAQEIALNCASFLEDSSNSPIPLWVNIGENRTTTSENAVDDYLAAARYFPGADGFVINVSSPNTQGLRNLQQGSSLSPLCQAVVRQVHPRPVLVKLSPDLSESDLKESVDAAATSGIQGFVVTNTTTSRPDGCPFPVEGGLSGKDLRSRSLQSLKWVRGHLKNEKNFLIISVGGILEYRDIQERLALGADLIEIYSALVFHGPRFFQKMHQQWKKGDNAQWIQNPNID